MRPNGFVFRISIVQAGQRETKGSDLGLYGVERYTIRLPTDFAYRAPPGVGCKSFIAKSNSDSETAAGRPVLLEILDHLADESDPAAVRVGDAIYDAVGKLAERPGIGHTREDLTDRPLRFMK